MPNEGKFNYQFDINKPWKYGLLQASFDFPIYKNDLQVQKEQDSILADYQPYFQIDKEAEKNVLSKLREDYNKTLRHSLPGTDYVRYIERTLKALYEDGIIAGLDVYARVFQILDEKTEISFNFKDGEAVKKGDLLGTVTGDIRVLLSGERVALNYLQRMSGIATYTKQVSKLLEGSKVTLLDTRKTTPNCRVFEKYAVRIGGGQNHRYNLSDGVLLKDNHIDAAGGVRERLPLQRHTLPLSVRLR